MVAGSVGVGKKYGFPCIVIFMGTATAIVYVDKNKAYWGGSICPGVGISLDALTSRGALLSSVDLRAPKKVISTNTTDSIRSGIVFGTACMIDGMIDKFVKEAECECKIIATGGLAKQIIKNCSHKIIYDENIILEGLNSIYKKNI
jgi:type III pantothenate kinase